MRGLPVGLTHEPPHKRRPMREVVLDVARDGVHAEHDRFGTLSLPSH